MKFLCSLYYSERIYVYLLPIHILWINLVTDGLPGLALVAEPAEKVSHFFDSTLIGHGKDLFLCDPLRHRVIQEREFY